MDALRQISHLICRVSLDCRPLSVALAAGLTLPALAEDALVVEPSDVSPSGEALSESDGEASADDRQKDTSDRGFTLGVGGDIAETLAAAVSPSSEEFPDWGASDVSLSKERVFCADESRTLPAGNGVPRQVGATGRVSCTELPSGVGDRDPSAVAEVPLPPAMSGGGTEDSDDTIPPNLGDMFADVSGNSREGLSRVPNLMGDGCAPGGFGGQTVVDRLVVVSQPASFTGSELISTNSATLYRFPANYLNVTTITAPVVPGAQALATVPGTPTTIGFTGASGSGGTLSFTGNAAQQSTGVNFQGAADAYFQSNIPVPPDQIGVTELAQSSSGAVSTGLPSDFSAFAYYDFVVGTAALTPGYNVGFVKLTENVSPLPRDRVYMNYSYFSDAFFSPQLRADVNRFMPGFEKTFFDGWTSVEFRTPFAATLDATQTQDLSTPAGITGDRGVEFGNLSAIFKSVIQYGDTWALTGGTQVMVPTASDVTIESALFPGREEVFIENQSTHVMPFVGFIWAPNSRFFSQALVQVDIDTNGNPVWANALQQDEIVAAGNFAGRLNYPTFLYVGMGAGYWVYQNNSRNARLTGVAPLFEVHVNQALEESDVICFENYVLGNELGVTSLVNALVGVNFEWGQRSTLTFGYATPIGGGVDRWFNGELRAMFNWRFGPQTRLTRVQF